MENLGLYIRVADEVLCFEAFVLPKIILGEQFAQNVVWLGVRNSALLDQFIATLPVSASHAVRR